MIGHPDDDPVLDGIAHELERVDASLGGREPNEAEALQMDALYDAQLHLTGRKVPEREVLKLTFKELSGDFLKLWRTQQGLKETNTEQQKVATFDLFGGFWGQRPIRGVQKKHAAEFVDALRQMKQEDRARVLIDGEETVELDFGAFQPRLCFHLSGAPLAAGEDPYSVPGYDPAVYRNAIKRAFGQLMNASPSTAPLRPGGRDPKALRDLFKTAGEYAEFFGAVESALVPIAEWFRAGRGNELQHIDSEIADAILADLTAKGIPCLPIFDSFIVPRSAQTALGRAMVEAYGDELLRRTGISAAPVIKGWSPTEEKELAEG